MTRLPVVVMVVRTLGGELLLAEDPKAPVDVVTPEEVKHWTISAGVQWRQLGTVDFKS